MRFLWNLINLFPAEVIFLAPDMEPPGFDRVITGRGNYVVTGRDNYVITTNEE